MSGQRKALIIANDEYELDALRDLTAPAADAEALGQVLGDPRIGDFTVDVIRNSPSHIIEARIEDLFADSRPDDLLLLHYSGHGLKSESGELFLAACNTRPTRLRASAVSADFVLHCMRDSRSRSIVLFLDCCYAGAFSQGATARAAGDINVLDSFTREKSGGRGRAVITASSAMEYAFEDGRLADDQHGRPSVFTTALVEGLSSGDADQDEDGWISLAELYNYVYDKVRERNPHQTPGCRFDLEGELYLARSGRLRINPGRVPPDLQAAIDNPDMFARLGAVGELRARLASDNLPAAVSAYQALTELARNDIRYVAEPAAAALSEAVPRPAQTELTFEPAEQGSVPRHQVVQLLGPPIARACLARPSDARIRADQVPGGLDVSVSTGFAGVLEGLITLEGPTGTAAIAVHCTMAPARPAPAEATAARAVAAAVPAEAAAATAERAADATAEPAAAPTATAPAPVRQASGQAAAGRESPLTEVVEPPRPSPAGQATASLEKVTPERAQPEQQAPDDRQDAPARAREHPGPLSRPTLFLFSALASRSSSCSSTRSSCSRRVSAPGHGGPSWQWPGWGSRRPWAAPGRTGSSRACCCGTWAGTSSTGSASWRTPTTRPRPRTRSSPPSAR